MARSPTFIAEFGVHESLPYIRAAGFWRGDHLKSASDLGVLIGVETAVSPRTLPAAAQQ